MYNRDVDGVGKRCVPLLQVEYYFLKDEVTKSRTGHLHQLKRSLQLVYRLHVPGVRGQTKPRPLFLLRSLHGYDIAVPSTG